VSTTGLGQRQIADTFEKHIAVDDACSSRWHRNPHQSLLPPIGALAVSGPTP
jgi:hypothetical protein